MFTFVTFIYQKSNNGNNNYYFNYGDKTGSDGSAPAPQISTVKQMPRRTQRLFFSATLSQDPEALQSYGLFEPVLFMSAVDSEVKLEKATNRKKVKSNFVLINLNNVLHTQRFVLILFSPPTNLYYTYRKQKKKRIVFIYILRIP